MAKLFKPNNAKNTVFNTYKRVDLVKINIVSKMD